jgi:hypothetical protein
MLNPQQCSEHQLVYSREEMSVPLCRIVAQGELAKWVGEHGEGLAIKQYVCKEQRQEANL